MIKKEPRYLTPKQAADYLGLSPKTLEKWRAAGTEGPPFVKMGAKAEVSHAGLQYLGVRVITYKKAFVSVLPLSDTPSVDTKPLGRPSLRPYILKAYSALKADGKIDFNNSLKAHVPIISWWVLTYYPVAMNGKTEIDYTTIQRTIGNQFRDRN